MTSGGKDHCQHAGSFGHQNSEPVHDLLEILPRQGGWPGPETVPLKAGLPLRPPPCPQALLPRKLQCHLPQGPLVLLQELRGECQLPWLCVASALRGRARTVGSGTGFLWGPLPWGLARASDATWGLLGTHSLLLLLKWFCFIFLI